MELSDQQKRLATVADAVAGMLEQSFRLVPHVPGFAGPCFIEEATVLQGDEEPEQAMLWGPCSWTIPREMSGFHLTLGQRTYRIYIEEVEVLWIRRAFPWTTFSARSAR